MPKDPPRRRHRSSTQDRRARIARIQSSAAEMSFRCSRCEEKNMKCFVETTSGRCAGCIHAQAKCDLLVPEADWEKVTREKREKRLQIARLEAQLAQSKVELLEVEEKEI